MQGIRHTQECWILFFIVSSIILFNVPLVFAQDQETDEFVETVPEGFTLSANIANGQALVSIKKEFSTDTASLESMITKTIEEFSITKDQADLLLTIEENNIELMEEFGVSINSRQCISQINIELLFIVDTTEREKILDAIVERTQLSKRHIEDSFEFEIDEVDIIVRVQDGKARVLVGYCDEKTTFVVSSSEEAEIISGISKKTGLREYKIPLVWSYTTDVTTPVEKPVTLEEQKEQALKYGEEVFENAASQLEKAESAQQLTAEGGPLPDSITNGGCLIATATFGSELSPQVQMLREIRDDTVLSTSSGASFMTAFNAFYYSFSPTVADWERQNPVFKEAVKVTITPLLSSLSLLQLVDIDTEEEMLGYGIGMILFNVGMYFIVPALIVSKLYKKSRT